MPKHYQGEVEAGGASKGTTAAGGASWKIGVMGRLCCKSSVVGAEA